MKIVIAVKREKPQHADDSSLQSALREAFCSKTDSSNTIVVVSIGSDQSMNQLETAIENGADKGIHIITQDSLNAYTVAECMSDIVKCESPDLIIISEQLTNEQCQTGKTLSSLLTESFPIKRSALDRKQYRLLVIREMLSGAHTVLLPIVAENNITQKAWSALTQYQEYLPFQPIAYSA